MRFIGLDPGSEQSAIFVFDGKLPAIRAAIIPNEDLIDELPGLYDPASFPNVFCMESMQSYGVTMGRSVVETLIWIGRFYDRYLMATGCGARLVLRSTIKQHICNNVAAKDGHVREALIDRWGPQGKKATPGPTYGISSHLWSALAIATYAFDKFKITP